jgi:DNA-binding transcriptional LysR family regulator
MPNTIPLSTLRVFESAGRTGSFRSAAMELALSPSAVSHAIRKLEEMLGARLFTRRGRSIELTTEGMTLMHHAAQAFETLRRGIDLVSRHAPRLLRLHVVPSFATLWLAPRLQAFLDANPGAEIRIAAGEELGRFGDGLHDAGIVCARTPSSRPMPDVVRIPLGEEAVVPLCAPEIARRIGGPTDLLRELLIHTDSKTLRWADWFAANGLAAPKPRGPRFDRSFLTIASAKDRLGVALESKRLAERDIAAGRLVEPLSGRSVDLHCVGHFLIYPQTGQINPLVGRMAKWLEKELGLVAQPAPA